MNQSQLNKSSFSPQLLPKWVDMINRTWLTLSFSLKAFWWQELCLLKIYSKIRTKILTSKWNSSQQIPATWFSNKGRIQSEWNWWVILLNTSNWFPYSKTTLFPWKFKCNVNHHVSLNSVLLLPFLLNHFLSFFHSH